eukprot:TRINITY_DN121128_c0_g1_i1.p1 TRINITY_DN121128_c0_g1~~TRINITY_DN121128_c0_g1_i1.p1  ORF type:complete len:354 (+),score=80.02 TRINITY_DN121128_c0_g1_i1:27-1064(+)
MERVGVISRHVLSACRVAPAAERARSLTDMSAGYVAPAPTSSGGMSLSPSARRAALRAVLKGTKVVNPASVFDPLSAQMAVHAGYEVIQLAGSVAANVTLGAPDLMLLSVTEFAGLVRRITRYCPLPLVVDADHGYGNAMGAARCVEELEAAGVAGLTIEDTNLPAAYGSTGQSIKGSAGGFQLTSPEEQRGKLIAAVNAKTDPETVVIARTSAYTVGGIEELTKRVAMYRDTGVDAVHVIGQLEAKELPALKEAAAPLPLMLSGAQKASAEELAALNVRLALSGHTPFMAAMQAAMEAMKAGKEGGKAPPTIDDKEFAKLLRVDGYVGVQKELIKVENPAKGMK